MRTALIATLASSVLPTGCTQASTSGNDPTVAAPHSDPPIAATTVITVIPTAPEVRSRSEAERIRTLGYVEQGDIYALIPKLQGDGKWRVEIQLAPKGNESVDVVRGLATREAAERCIQLLYDRLITLERVRLAHQRTTPGDCT